MRIIDLSHNIAHGMPVFPGDPNVRIVTHHNYENGYFVSRMDLGTHAGTHVDAPVHVDPAGMTVGEIPISRFIGRAYVMDLTDMMPIEEISQRHLTPFAEKVKDTEAVIIKTGWGAHFGRDDFFVQFPGLDESAADWLCSNGVRLFGLETPSVNPKRHLEIHKCLLGRGVVVVESLANVNELHSEYVTLYAVPLRLQGLDGSPVRAFAIEE